MGDDDNDDDDDDDDESVPNYQTTNPTHQLEGS